MSAETKKCPQCGEEIKAEAKLCRFCGAKFEVAVKAYCANCRAVVTVTDEGKCPQCGGEVIDRRIESTLITQAAPAPQAAAPLEAGGPEPPGPADRYLQPGEQVVYRTRLHNSMLWGAGFEFVIALAVAGFGLWLGPKVHDPRLWIIVGPAALLALIAGVAIVAQYFASEVVLTDRRVLATVLWGLRVNVPLADISNVQTVGRGKNSGVLTIVKRNGQKAFVGPIPDPEDLQVMIAERARIEISEPSPQTAQRVVAVVVSFVLLAFAASACYVALYHDGPPIPGVEQIFRNVQYDLSDARPMPLAKDGYFIWSITNQNDFAWPEAHIVYGDHHAFPLERVEPGETAAFSNMLLYNFETKQIDPAPLLKGQSVELRLYIDFAEEDYWAAQLKKLVGLSVESYGLGTWSR